MTFVGMMSMDVNGFLVRAARYPNDFVIHSRNDQQIWSNCSDVSPKTVAYAGGRSSIATFRSANSII